jgi:hypothetical protein
MRAAIYARVSTSNNGQNPEMQLRELREYCVRRGLAIAGEYVDAGISGTKVQRPQLDALLAVCRKRCVDAVLVYRYDRFARSLRQLVNALEEFRSLGIEFISLHEGVDTSTPNGRLVFGIFDTWHTHPNEVDSASQFGPDQQNRASYPDYITTPVNGSPATFVISGPVLMPPWGQIAPAAKAICQVSGAASLPNIGWCQ